MDLQKTNEILHGLDLYNPDKSKRASFQKSQAPDTNTMVFLQDWETPGETAYAAIVAAFGQWDKLVLFPIAGFKWASGDREQTAAAAVRCGKMEEKLEELCLSTALLMLLRNAAGSPVASVGVVSTVRADKELLVEYLTTGYTDRDPIVLYHGQDSLAAEKAAKEFFLKTVR